MQKMSKMKIRCTVAQVQMIRSSLESKWRGTASYKHQKLVVRFGLSSWGVWLHHAEIKRVRWGPQNRTLLMFASLSSIFKWFFNNLLLVTPLSKRKNYFSWIFIQPWWSSQTALKSLTWWNSTCDVKMGKVNVLIKGIVHPKLFHNLLTSSHPTL